MMGDEARHGHATTVSSLNIVHEHNKLNRVHEFPLRKQGAVVSLSASRERDEGRAAGRAASRAPGRPSGSRKISTKSVPEGKDALVLLHNGNHGDTYFLAEGDEQEVEDDDEVDEEEDVAGTRAPDGGWGWAVVAAAFFINMASDGISFSFGLLFIEFLRYFGESRSNTSWIGSLFMAVPMLTGPVASAMVDRYGCRAMTILGGIISAIGFVFAAFSSTIGQMYLTFGVLAGLGLGLCFITAVVSIAYWFERKRTLAMSLGAAGTGFGTFVYAPMTNYFISEYGWRGTVLLLAGTFLNLCVCGVVMRDPPWWAAEQRRARRGEGRCTARGGLGRNGTGTTAVEELLPVPVPIPRVSRVARSLPYTRPLAMTTRSEDNLASLIRHSAPPTPSSATPTFNAFNTIPEMVQDEQAAASTPLLPSPAPSAAPSGTLSAAPSSTLTATPRSVLQLPLQSLLAAAPATASSQGLAGRRAAFNGTPLRAESLPCFRRRVSLTPTSPLFPTPPTLTAAPRRSSSLKDASSFWHSCCPGSPSVVSDRPSKRWYSNTLELVRAMLDFSLFLELHFLLMSVGTTLLYTWFVVPYFYLADHLIRNGYTEAEASRLLGVVGVANTVGMVVLGWVGDHPRLSVTKTYAVCLTVCGTSTACMLVFTERYWLLVVACAAFGVTFASTFSFTPTILVTLVPMERFTIAYGLNLLCQGIGNLLGPPFAGWLFDLTHSWDLSFYMAGFWIVVAGLLTGLISYSDNRHLLGAPLEGADPVGGSSGISPSKASSMDTAAAVS